MQHGGWRQHVRAELRRRERSGRGLRGLLERHEKLQDRLEAQQLLLLEKLLPPGEALRPPLEEVSLWVQHEMEVKELRHEKEELRQQIALVTDMLGATEAENQEQRGRMGRLAQDLEALKRHSEELECAVWLSTQEAEGLRRELAQARGLLQEAQQARLELETRWVREKAREAERLNWANDQEEKHWRKMSLLREKLERVREAAGLRPRPGGGTALGDGDGVSTSCEEAETAVAEVGAAADQKGTLLGSTELTDLLSSCNKTSQDPASAPGMHMQPEPATRPSAARWGGN